MSTLLLQYAGQAVGGAIAGPFGAVLGRAAGALVGNFIDRSLIGAMTKPARAEGPRLDDLQVQASSEGANIPRVYGRVRLSGQVIWATRFEEEISTTTRKSGGKGGAAGGAKTKVTEYSYYANLAIGLCEGQIARIGQVWADGKPLDLSAVTMRVYTGSEDQQPDSLIAAVEGLDQAPSYRGLAYVVFERLPIGPFGNRIPQLSFEVFSPLDDLESRISGVNIIPGATEFGYHTTQISRDAGNGVSETENTHTYAGKSDWSVSMDDLQASCPNLHSASLVVTWFGDDLRCGECTLKPGVDNASKTTTPESWAVAGLGRASAHQMSLIDGAPAFGGTPSDASIIAAIADLKTRGLKTVFYPFVMMDIPAGNGLPDPWGAQEQAAYPWRGRITCHPGPGMAGTVDKTDDAQAQVSAFVGAAAVSDFAVSGQNVVYSGPEEWSLRRMILHYAHLCALAGDVDTFLIGTELKSLTILRNSANAFPFVAALQALAADVKTVLGAQTDVSYSADWSEYFGYQPADGSGDVWFHLDPLWASPDVDFIGIDNYMPLADWRNGEAHLDRAAGWRSTYQQEYLRANIAGGEGYDWYYASPADRDAQTRTPISDGAYAKPWVYRYKDLKSWWSEPHYNRPGGVEAASPTGWTPQSKPFRFMEAGCAAVDKGANQPNLFPDAKSSESGLPYYSTGARDELMQRAYIEAMLDYWDTASTAQQPGSNPVSAVYGAPMVDVSNVHFWAWDARPFPQFPLLADVWADAPNWRAGHWLNGRLGFVPLGALVAALGAGEGLSLDVSALEGLVEGYVQDRPLSAREAIEPLSLAYFFDAVESVGGIRFSHRKNAAALSVGAGRFVPDEKGEGDGWSLVRAQETELPATVRVSYVDSMEGYRRSAVESHRLVARSHRQARADLPIVMSQAMARAIAETWLQELWTERERASLTLPPSHLAAEPGDALGFEVNGRALTVRIDEITDGDARKISGVCTSPALYEAAPYVERTTSFSAPAVIGPALVEYLDLPLHTGAEPEHVGYIAAFAHPWPGGVAVYRAPDETGYELNRLIEAPATMGETTTALAAGPLFRWDNQKGFRVRLYGGALQSVDTLKLLSGSNAAALMNPDGDWEVIQFRNAALVGDDTYELSGLLRGQAGTESAMTAPLPVGARFVLLDGTLAQADMTIDDIGLPFNWRAGPYSRDIADPSYREAGHAFTGLGRRPLSPVHIRALRDAVSADVQISWVRRTRIGGDSWEVETTPLSESAESYQLTIINTGGEALRSAETATPQFTYTQAMQIEDFGSVPAEITLDIAQISESYGPGSPGRKILHV